MPAISLRGSARGLPAFLTPRTVAGTTGLGYSTTFMGAQSARGFALSCVVFSTSHLVSVDAAAEDRGAAQPITAPPAANTAGSPGGAPAVAPPASGSSSAAPSSPPGPAPSVPPGSALPPAGGVPPGYGQPGTAASATTSGPSAPAAPPAYPSPPYDYGAQRAAWERSWAAAGWSPEPKRRWYGWQTLLVDGASVVLLAVGGASNSSSDASVAAAAFGSIGYLFGAPIVHAAHGNWGKAGGSFAFRAGSIVLLLIGAVSCTNGSFEGNCSGGDLLLVLGALGIPAAIAVDAAVIAREDVAPGDDDEARVLIRPWVAKHGRGGGMSLGGAF